MASEWASEAGRATLTRQPRFAARKAARSVGRLPSLVPRITHARTPALDVISGNFFQKVLSRACMFDLVIQQARIAAQQQGDNCKRAMDWLRTFLNDRGYYSKLSLFATYFNASSSSILCQEREFKEWMTLNGLLAKISLNHITRWTRIIKQSSWNTKNMETLSLPSPHKLLSKSMSAIFFSCFLPLLWSSRVIPSP